jgi:hypothetical protein
MTAANDPAVRAGVLRSIRPEDASAHHDLLRLIFREEAEHRRAGGGNDVDDDDEHFENLYWCAFLLCLVGDPADVPMMWEAKHIDFDAGCGFDVQFLTGAGFEATIAYLRRNRFESIAEELAAFPELREDRSEWLAHRRQYFYGPE